MAARDFLLPDLGEGLTEGEVVRWLVAEGDTVDVDQPVAEIETAKAVVEVPSPFAGTVTALHAEVGTEVAVGQPLITVAEGRGSEQTEEGAAPADAAAGDMVPDAPPDPDGSGNVLVGYGTGPARGRRRRSGSAEPAPAGPRTAPAEAAPGGDRPLAKPPVRKLAKDLGIDLADVPGSGPGGVVTREDVEAYAHDGGRPEAEVERIPLTGIRKTIAAHMARSRREIPEAVTWVDVDASALVTLRAELDAAYPDVKVTPLAIILRACLAGLRRFPMLNARLDAERDEIVVLRGVHLGVAVHTDAGLMVPVITGAERLSTLELAGELQRLAAGARDRTLRPDELRGSTFTVTNYGGFGVDGGDMVINHPEAAILGVGRIVDRPWVVSGEAGRPEVAVRKVAQLSLAFDHRVCDGGDAGRFLRYVADLVESPARLVGAL